jgi:ATP phosphoribosyltransferase
VLNIALPKGRLGEKTYSLFEEIGYKCKELTEDSRKLIFENKEKNIRYLLVKTLRCRNIRGKRRSRYRCCRKRYTSGK